MRPNQTPETEVNDITKVNKQSCSSCAFWRSMQGEQGFCVFNPPQMMIVGMKQTEIPQMNGNLIIGGKPQVVTEPLFNAHFPLMAGYGWCGKWEVRDFEGGSPDISDHDLGVLLDLRQRIELRNGEANGSAPLPN